MKKKKHIFISILIVCFMLLGVVIKMNITDNFELMDVLANEKEIDNLAESKNGYDNMLVSNMEKQEPNDLLYRTFSLGKVFTGNEIVILKDDLLSVMENPKDIEVYCDGQLYDLVPYEDMDWSCGIIKDGTYFILAVNTEGEILDVTEYAQDNNIVLNESNNGIILLK